MQASSSQSPSGILQAAQPRKQTTTGVGRQANWLPLWLLLPSMLILLAFQVAPSVYSIYLSMTRVRGGELSWVGLGNFERLLNSRTFIASLQNSLVYSASYIILTVSLGLLIALLLNRRIRFTGWYLIIIFIPWVVSDVVAGTMWRWLFQPSYGLIQTWLTNNVPLIDGTLFTDRTGAMVIVILVSVWQGLALTTILSLGALQAVPKDVEESAALDGANRAERFFYVIFPLIRPTFLVLILLTSIRSINSVGLIFATTRGEPGGATQTASVYLLETGWARGDFGTGAAVSVILLAVNIVLTLVYLRLIGQKGDV